MNPETTNRKAEDWGKAIILALMAFFLFLLPNSIDAQGFTLSTLWNGVVLPGAMLSAVVAFLTAMWE